MAAIDVADDVILRWEQPNPSHVPLLASGGITAVVAPESGPEFERACSDAGIAVANHSPELPDHGVWPGAGRPPNARNREYEVAGASAEPWVDANMHWYAWLKALRPDRPPVLGYLPSKETGLPPDRLVPFETLELALIEARVNGGNYILAPEPRYRAALLRGEPDALSAWKQLGATARWLKRNAAPFHGPTIPNITALVEPGDETAEIANLLFRHGASPQLAPLSAPPPPDPENIRALVAVNLREIKPPSAAAILAHARSGSTVALDSGAASPWWRQHAGPRFLQEHDREFYRLGKGRLVVYNEPVADPSDFALDVIDLVSHPRRAVRLWAANTLVPVVKLSPPGMALALVNYGSRSYDNFLARVQGNYTSATLLRPEAGEIELKPSRRGTTTEILLPEINKAAIVLFR